MLIRSRRDFLKATIRSATAIGAGSAMAKFATMNALAANPAPTPAQYSALVCIFLAGGNDGHNMVVPITTAKQNYSLYAQARGGLTIPQASLLSINNGADTYGLHPSMPEMKALYNGGQVAILANVGMLAKPLGGRVGYQAAPAANLPSQLFSHSDQTGQWQTAIPSGLGSSGWGGRMADAMQNNGQNGGAKFPPVSSIVGCGQFCNGVNNLPSVIPPTTIPASGLATQATAISRLGGFAAGSSGALEMQQLLSFDNGLLLVQGGNNALSNGANYANTIAGLLPNNKLTTLFPANNPLANQLLTAANVMSIQSQLGITRQIFFCTLGGFDTHGSQNETQPGLLQQLSQAMNAFYNCISNEMGIAKNVTTFTASEFGRTLSPSGADGSDHAWGNHHFIMGGDVIGTKIYGTFPSLALGGPDDANSRGTLIPSTGVDQYAATLAKWFGVSDSDMPTVLPNLANFQVKNLNFLA